MMKKVIVLLTALAVTAGFAGCQREAMMTDSGQDTVDVNTHLVLNVATGAPQTKQVSEAVQTADNFRGMDKVHLLSYKLGSDDKLLTSAATADKFYLLNRLFGGETTRRVISIDVPVGTNTLVLYGKSPDVTGEVGGYSAEDYFGHLAVYSPNKEIGSSYFQLGNRLTDATNYVAMKSYIAGILTNVMATALETSHAGISVDGISLVVDPDAVPAIDEYPENITWKTYGAITNKQSIVEKGSVWYVMEEKLANLYNQMTTIGYTGSSANDELRAGSGAAVLGMVADMWQVILSITGATATTKAEAVAKQLALNINTKLATYFSYSNTTGENPVPDWETLKFKESVEGYKPDEFPSNFNLMAGAAYLTCTDGVFSYADNYNTTVIGMGDKKPYDGSTGYTASDFYYPAELLYFGNSPVRTATVEYTANQYPTTADWQSYAWTNWPGHHIEKETQSVAMVNNIRYGVAMLETKVAYSAKVHTAGKLVDNSPAVTGDGAIEIAVADNTFKLTGIIIGGQPKHVGWNFLPVKEPDTASPTYDKMVSGFIYDKAVGINVPYSDAAVTGSTPNYTVVFDNYSTGSTQETVHIALEFQNKSGKAFYGMKNKIPVDGYFYLIGELDPGQDDTGFAWPTDRIIPPYSVSGETTEVKRVFIQSLMTSATFKIGENSLKYAYLTVPDLRSTSMTLGLSVDIEWKEGLKYGDVIVGGPENE